VAIHRTPPCEVSVRLSERVVHFTHDLINDTVPLDEVKIHGIKRVAKYPWGCQKNDPRSINAPTLLLEKGDEPFAERPER
jgi:hypothetical protein